MFLLGPAEAAPVQAFLSASFSITPLCRAIKDQNIFDYRRLTMDLMSFTTQTEGELLK